jgi:hypothetical protein
MNCPAVMPPTGHRAGLGPRLFIAAWHAACKPELPFMLLNHSGYAGSLNIIGRPGQTGLDAHEKD